VSERDGKTEPVRPDALADFPEEFEQAPGAPPRDLARRARAPSPASRAAIARVEAMRKKVEALARGDSSDEDAT